MEAFIEKPEPGEVDVNTINAGTYVMEPEVLDLVPPDVAVSVEREVFPELVGNGLYGRAERVSWIDIGTPQSYLEANLAEMGQNGTIDPSAVIDPAAEVRDSVVGAGRHRRRRRQGDAQRAAAGRARRAGGRGHRAGDRDGRPGVVDRDAMQSAIAGLAGNLREGDVIGRAVGETMPMPEAVVITGMGGSAMGGELLRSLIAGLCPVPITRVRGFGIPRWAGEKTLVVCVSYSGNTAETLSCAQRAHAQNADLLAVGAGGRLGELASEWGVPFARVPDGMQPRAALGYLFGATAGAFAACGLAPDDVAAEAAAGVEQVDLEAARSLGERLAPTVPLIYGSGPMAAVAYRWKTQLNENAKMHAFSHAFPELDHNEIVGWAGAPRDLFSAVVLRDESEGPEMRKMIEATCDLIGADAALVEQVRGAGGSASARAFSMVAHGDWVSYHAALARGEDPMPVERIGELKRRVARA